MSELPPLMRDQRKVDGEHLKLLAVFHFVVAGLSILGLGILFLHWFFMHSIFDNPDLFKQAKNGPPPKEFFAIFQWFYVIFGACLVTGGVLNVISGWAILRRRARIYSLVVAGLDCAFVPLGTALGAFTFVVLLRDSVREVYEAARSPVP